MDRVVKTGLGSPVDRHELRFNAGMEPKTVRFQNASADTDAYVRFAADDGTVPSASNYDVIVPHGGAVIEFEDISLQVMVSNPVNELAVIRY